MQQNPVLLQTELSVFSLVMCTNPRPPATQVSIRSCVRVAVPFLVAPLLPCIASPRAVAVIHSRAIFPHCKSVCWYTLREAFLSTSCLARGPSGKLAHRVTCVAVSHGKHLLSV